VTLYGSVHAIMIHPESKCQITS